MSPNEVVQKALEVIGEAVSLEPDDLQEHETWKFLGLGENLQNATASDLSNALDFAVTPKDFQTYPDVGSFKSFLQQKASGGKGAEAPSNGTSAAKSTLPEPEDPWEGIPKPKVPLSVVLQGKPDTAKTIMFLFPDGSGAGTSYGTLPPISSDGSVCLVGLNSPFLRQAQNFTCSIERMARLWVDEVRRLQPKGKPYVLGGWSAGGYYSYEVTKLLTASGEKVERLILIDSPCRLEYEALPEQVVAELTRKGLMGASGERKAPEWLVQHFTSTVISVETYHPTPLPRERVPAHVDFVWVKEGLVKSVPESGLQVDMNVKVTRFLLEPRPDLKTEHWEKLLPGAEYSFGYMTGNHFQITQMPHVESLGKVLKSVAAGNS
ncbi:hypothetical protein KC354_g11460 [Hortaea werneckii]|nr:hypothetical protein KC354_g11460 [Hortaea werneckii]